MAETPKRPEGKPAPRKKSAATGGKAATGKAGAPAKSPAQTPAQTPGQTPGQTPAKPKTAAKAVAKSPGKPAAAKARAAKTETVRTGDDLRKATAAWRAKNERIALVATMGALHEGHIALVEKAKASADRTVVSIFVNPTQFAPNEDLERYPRNEEADLKQLSALGVDLVWMPSLEEMYPDGFSTGVKPGRAAGGLETDFRPHFFGGVATVVAKLFNQVRPDLAVFGEKDYQQLIVVRQLARDLDMNLEVVGVQTVREKDGLALSSRNAYLSETERAIAPNLNLVLNEVAHAAASGASIAHLKAAAQMRLLTLGFAKVDYVEVRDAETLEPYDVDAGRPGRVLGAAWLGRTRLIDNVPVAL